MRLMIERNGFAAAMVLCGAIFTLSSPALGSGNGDPSPALGLHTDEGLKRASDQTINETLDIAKGLLLDGFPPNPENARRLRSELDRRELDRREREARNLALLLGPPPPVEASAPTAAPPLTPPTPATPPPTASNCGQTGATCADNEARQRQADKAETKRAQAAAADWAKQQGFIR